MAKCNPKKYSGCVTNFQPIPFDEDVNRFINLLLTSLDSLLLKCKEYKGIGYIFQCRLSLNLLFIRRAPTNMLVEILIFVLTTLIGYYLYIYKKIHYFYENRGIKYLPGVPFFGNMRKSFLLKAHIWEDFDEVYRAFPDEKYVGFIEGTTPAILIREPDIIKNVTIKDFDHFVNHKKFLPDDIGSMFGDSLLMLKDDKWRDMRTTLSPAFTCSKMRLMVPFMVEISNNIVQYLKEHKSEDIDVYDLMQRYTNDVIASAGFGLQVNSLIEKDNAFYKCGQAMFNFSLSQRIGLLIHAQFPYLVEKFGFRVVSAATENFFRDIVATTIDYRIRNNVERPDMIQLLMETSRGTLKHGSDEEKDKDLGFGAEEYTPKPHETRNKWSENELAAQVFIFFVAGFETVANALTICIHELALNYDIQEKLYQELRAYNEIKRGFQYDSINELKYLDCVINEASRKWSAAVVIDRICTKSYDLPPPRDGAKPYRVKPGDLIYSAANSIQMDPKYFPNPDIFDPERFSDDNKNMIKSGTFIPFGIGPRNCIGGRFAILEIKVLMYHIVHKFKILKCEKTTDPIRLQPLDFNMKALGGTWVKFEPRE